MVPRTLREQVNSSIRQAPAGANDLRLSRRPLHIASRKTALDELGPKRSPGARQPDIGICGKVAWREFETSHSAGSAGDCFNC